MKEKLNIIIFLAALVLLLVVVLILPHDENAQDFENRSMAPMPELNAAAILDGSFFQGIESYLSDSVAYRTGMLQFAAGMEQSYGIRISGSAMMVDTAGEDLGFGLLPEVDDGDLSIDIATPAPDGTDAAPAPGSTEATPAPDGTDAPPAPGSTPQSNPPPTEAPGQTNSEHEEEKPTVNRVDPSKPFSIDVNYHEDAIFYERYRENAGTTRRYAEILNSYLDRTPDNVRVFSMLAPIRVEFMGERYAASNDSQRATIDKINDLLDKRIIRTATYEWLAANSGEYIYFRTDHHWTALGAYYAYISFAQAAGFNPLSLTDYIEHSIPSFLGSYAIGTSNRTVRDHPDTLYYYELDNGTAFSRTLFVPPQENARLTYRVFMGGDYAKLDFTSSNINGKTLVIIKDSFANALIPWLAPHYERIIVIDPRQHNGSVTRLLSELDSADLLFMNYVAATAMADFIETIYNVR